MTCIEQQPERPQEIVSEVQTRRQRMRAKVTIGRAEHVNKIARTRTPTLSHRDVVSEDLAQRRRDMLEAVEETLYNLSRNQP